MSVLRPVVIIGTGFHRWFAGAANDCPLVSWPGLLREVAIREGISPLNEKLPPTFYWESLLLALSESTGGSKQVNQIENDARGVVVDIIKSCSPNSSRSAEQWLAAAAAIISLNFDLAWMTSPSDRLFDARKNKPLSSAASTLDRRLFGYIPNADIPVWFPNGSILSPQTIRLGLRDYGFAAEECVKGFNQLKQYQREHRLLSVVPAEGQVQAARAHAGWVADFMMRPILFLGVGMSEAEQGLWWLLAQRERNLSKITPKARPYAQILLHERDNGDRKGFWDAKPMGLSPLWCKQWEFGWKKAAKLLVSN